MRTPFVSRLIAELAPPCGIRVELEPEFQFAGELIFPNGRRHVFKNNNLNINPAGSVDIAKDKEYTKFFLRKHGINVPAGRAFFSDRLNRNLPRESRRGLEEAKLFARQLGYPVYVKPNDLSQGLLVAKVQGEEQLLAVASKILQETHVFLVEAPCAGRDYRIVVLGGKIISAYERTPLAVLGDGISTVAELLKQAKSQLSASGRPNSEIDLADFRIGLKLEGAGLSADSVIAGGARLALLDNANLSTGGSSVDATGAIHPEFAELSLLACRALGLRFAGVDVICADLGRPPGSQEWHVIEVNGAPGLDNYAALGAEQAGRVRDLYQAILEYLALEA